MRLLPLLALLALPACTKVDRPTAGPSANASAWQTIATPADRQRLRDWRQAFTAGLRQAREAGHSATISREGALLQPDAALGGGIPNGDYRCRVVKLGAKQQGLLPFIAYPSFSCRITAASRTQRFAKLTGSQRQVGAIYPHDQLRSAFLGTLVLGDEARAMPYGADSERDLAGWVERIGERRWRLLLPYPRFESQIDVVELIPA